MADVSIKDNDNLIHQINVDTLSDNTDTQIVKLQIGNTGENGGLVSFDNPIPTQESGFLRLLHMVFGRFSFGATSALRTEISNTPAVTISSGTVTTVTTMTTGNVGFGDSGKASTIQQTSALMFYGSVGANFIRS